MVYVLSHFVSHHYHFPEGMASFCDSHRRVDHRTQVEETSIYDLNP